MTFKEYYKTLYPDFVFEMSSFESRLIEAYAAYNAKAFMNHSMNQPEDSDMFDTAYDNFKFKKDQN